MKVKNTTCVSHSWYYYHFHEIRVVLFINSSRTVVFPLLIPLTLILHRTKSYIFVCVMLTETWFYVTFPLRQTCISVNWNGTFSHVSVCTATSETYYKKSVYVRFPNSSKRTFLACFRWLSQTLRYAFPIHIFQEKKTIGVVLRENEKLECCHFRL